MSDLVTLSIPVSADLLVLARLTAATVASRAGFDVEEIEDLRLAVDELCISLVNEGGGGRLELEFIRDAGLIEVS
ncbi:MAG TPA: anti-sigma factor, partial [Candidatus Dormibacteraeota bacterium]|nr:anti-sigma factor [Candidatus Dormibacteraeota bacterium]